MTTVTRVIVKEDGWLEDSGWHHGHCDWTVYETETGSAIIGHGGTIAFTQAVDAIRRVLGLEREARAFEGDVRASVFATAEASLHALSVQSDDAGPSNSCGAAHLPSNALAVGTVPAGVAPQLARDEVTA